MRGAGVRDRVGSLLATAAAAFLVLGSPNLIGGCSFVFVRGVEKEAPGRVVPGDCSTRKVAPVMDVIITGAEATAAYVALRRSETDYQGMSVSRGDVVGTAVALTLLFAVSSMYGFATVATCREVRDQVESPYRRDPTKQTRGQRQSEEATEEAGVQARAREKAAADAKAAGEAAARARHPDGGAPTAR